MDKEISNKDELAEMKKVLPYQYGKIIADKLVNINQEQVRNVFLGNLTDPAIVLPVLQEARKMYLLQKAVNAEKKAFMADLAA